MKVYGTRKSRAFRVLWLLEEMGMEYVHFPVMPHDSGLTGIYPRGKIPVIVDDDLVITDSTAILHYLSDRYAREFTSPPGTPERATQDSMTCMILDEFDSCLWAAARHSFILPEELRVRELKETLKWEFDRSVTALIERAEFDPFLLGDRLTVPDFIFAHCLLWSRVAKFPLTQPVLLEYIRHVERRPAYSGLVAKDDLPL